VEEKLFPDSLPEFERMFDTETKCRDHLYQIKYPNGFVCPKCGETAFWWSAKHVLCCKHCQNQVALRAGTVMESSKKPLLLWYRAIFLVSFQKNGISAKNLQNQLGFGSYQTAWSWLQKIRRSMRRKGREKLTGEIEVDEAYYGGKKSGKRGRGSENKKEFAIAVETKGKQIGRIRMECIKDSSAESLHSFVYATIEQKSTLITDGWKSYLGLQPEHYTHTVKTKKNEEDLLPSVHLCISLFKRWMLGIHQGLVQKKHLQFYLDEFVFRFNRRKSKSRGQVFYRLLEQVVCCPVTTYRELVASPAT
jgi:transposase-like protein/ribosomal protein L37AE/L43A